jgi:hypothetical protein
MNLDTCTRRRKLMLNAKPCGVYGVDPNKSIDVY